MEQQQHEMRLAVEERRKHHEQKLEQCRKANDDM